MPRLRNLLKDHPEGMRLEDFLAQQAKADTKVEQLRQTRALYVIAPNMEKGQIVKFGIAGTKTGNAINRINEYVIMYGKEDPTNKCVGCKIYFCGITKYNRPTADTPSEAEKNTYAYKMELKLKRLFAATTAIAAGRGAERINTAKVSLKDLLKTINALNDGDIEEAEEIVEAEERRVTRSQTKVTTTPPKERPVTRSRTKQDAPKENERYVLFEQLQKERGEKREETKRKLQALILPSDKILEVLSHRRRGKGGKTEYLLRWNRPYEYGKLISDETYETLSTIEGWYKSRKIKKKQFDEFKTMIDNYKNSDKNINADFYD
jgi:hypothetical protein